MGLLRGQKGRESRSSSGVFWVCSPGWERNRPKRLKQTHPFRHDSYLQANNGTYFLLCSFRLLTWRKSWWKQFWPHGKSCWSFLLQCWSWVSWCCCPLLRWWSGGWSECRRSLCTAQCEPALLHHQHPRRMAHNDNTSQGHSHHLWDTQKNWVYQSVATKFLWKENVCDFVVTNCSSPHFAFHFLSGL